MKFSQVSFIIYVYIYIGFKQSNCSTKQRYTFPLKIYSSYIILIFLQVFGIDHPQTLRMFRTLEEPAFKRIGQRRAREATKTWRIQDFSRRPFAHNVIWAGRPRLEFKRRLLIGQSCAPSLHRCLFFIGSRIVLPLRNIRSLYFDFRFETGIYIFFFPAIVK